MFTVGYYGYWLNPVFATSSDREEHCAVVIQRAPWARDKRRWRPDAIKSLNLRVGFLFNHDQVHQLRHSLPIAIELAARGKLGTIVALTSSPRLTAEVQQILREQSSNLEVQELSLRSGAGKLFDAGLNWLIPARKLAIYRDNLDVFAALDVLVVAEKTSAVLKSRYGLKDLKIIHTRHGAGDRAIGFNRASAKFDKVLVSGETIRARLIADAGVEPSRIEVVGYPKFDLEPGNGAVLPFADSSRPTVLYNPHVAPHLSSWFRHGKQVLEFFAANQDYNLIFAPHVMLFERPVTVTISPPRLHLPGGIPDHILRAPNIHIDVSSPACTDMTYTRAADIYLGDVSSQIYEFIVEPRPCIFLNSHGRTGYERDPNFAHWAAGEVIDDVGGLDAALRTAVEHPDRYKAAQQQLFASHIDMTAEKSSTRAARAIERFALGLDEPADLSRLVA